MIEKPSNVLKVSRPPTLPKPTLKVSPSGDKPMVEGKSLRLIDIVPAVTSACGNPSEYKVLIGT